MKEGRREKEGRVTDGRIIRKSHRSLLVLVCLSTCLCLLLISNNTDYEPLHYTLSSPFSTVTLSKSIFCSTSRFLSKKTKLLALQHVGVTGLYCIG